MPIHVLILSVVGGVGGLLLAISFYIWIMYRSGVRLGFKPLKIYMAPSSSFMRHKFEAMMAKRLYHKWFDRRGEVNGSEAALKRLAIFHSRLVTVGWTLMMVTWFINIWYELFIVGYPDS